MGTRKMASNPYTTAAGLSDGSVAGKDEQCMGVSDDLLSLKDVYVGQSEVGEAGLSSGLTPPRGVLLRRRTIQRYECSPIPRFLFAPIPPLLAPRC